MKRILKSTAIIRGAIAFLLSLFVLSVQGRAYDRDDCTRTVTCSDGYKIITTDCSSLYNITIINGHRTYMDTDDNNTVHNDGQSNDNSHDNDSVWGPSYRRHHPHPPDDPCREGHGYMIDDGLNNLNSTAKDNTATSSSSDETVSDDPYHLREKLKQNNS
jgi:hypothetical protein